MASLLIRRLPERVKARLRVRAAEHGHSMEQEAREILEQALAKQRPPRNLVESIRARFAPLGYVDLPEFPDEPVREPPAFD